MFSYFLVKLNMALFKTDESSLIKKTRLLIFTIMLKFVAEIFFIIHMFCI
jgi:hypothetical protein